MRAAAFILFSVLLNLVLNFKVEITPLESGDDQTRAWAATHAAMTGMQFGTDVVYTEKP